MLCFNAQNSNILITCSYILFGLDRPSPHNPIVTCADIQSDTAGQDRTLQSSRAGIATTSQHVLASEEALSTDRLNARLARPPLAEVLAPAMVPSSETQGRSCVSRT